MDYHKKPRLTIRISDEVRDNLTKIVSFYGFKNIGNFVTNLIYFGCATEMPHEDIVKMEDFASDLKLRAIKGKIETDGYFSILSLSQQEILTLVKFIKDNYGDGLLYCMCESDKNDIMEYLSVAREPWTDIIQRKYMEVCHKAVRKEDIRYALRVWFMDASKSGQFKSALQDFLKGKIAKKMAELEKMRQNEDKL